MAMCSLSIVYLLNVSENNVQVFNETKRSLMENLAQEQLEVKYVD